MTSVYKMSRSQLVSELESFPMDVIGNIHDLRESVKLGRAIIKMYLEVPVEVPEPEPTPDVPVEVPEPEPTPEVQEPVPEVQVPEVPKKFIVSVIECEEYVPFGTFSSEAEAETAIDLDVKNECLNCDCAPGDEDYETMYKEFRDCFKIEVV